MQDAVTTLVLLKQIWLSAALSCDHTVKGVWRSQADSPAYDATGAGLDLKKISNIKLKK